MLKNLFSLALVIFILVLQVPIKQWVELTPDEQRKLKIVALQRYANHNRLAPGTIFSFREEITDKFFELHITPSKTSWGKKEQGC